MDEKIQEMLDCAKSQVTAAGTAAAAAACDLGNRAMDLLTVSRQSVRLAELESAVLTELRHVGEMIYATHTGTPTKSEVLLAKLREIDALYDEMNVLKREIARARRIPVCDVCGRIGEKGDLYCRDCGQPL